MVGFYLLEEENQVPENQPKLLVRTEENFDDTKQAFGWIANKYEFCLKFPIKFPKDKCEAGDWKKGQEANTYFETNVGSSTEIIYGKKKRPFTKGALLT